MEEFLKTKYVQILIIIVLTFIMLKVINYIYNIYKNKKGKTLHVVFLKNLAKGFVVTISIFEILSFTTFFKQFSTTILFSSSLLVVVLGFILQQGLSNIVHGFIISIFKPFEIGDRIETVIDGVSIKGIVKSINLRHAVITTTIDNANLIIPNSKFDVAAFKNYSNGDEVNRYPISVDVTYEDAINKEKREKIKQIISDTIINHPLVIDTREENNENLFVKVELCEYSIKFTSFVTTKTYSDNFLACSEITELIIEAFNKENISFAYPHYIITNIKQ